MFIARLQAHRNPKFEHLERRDLLRSVPCIERIVVTGGKSKYCKAEFTLRKSNEDAQGQHGTHNATRFWRRKRDGQIETCKVRG